MSGIILEMCSLRKGGGEQKIDSWIIKRFFQHTASMRSGFQCWYHIHGCTANFQIGAIFLSLWILDGNFSAIVMWLCTTVINFCFFFFFALENMFSIESLQWCDMAFDLNITLIAYKIACETVFFLLWNGIFSHVDIRHYIMPLTLYRNQQKIMRSIVVNITFFPMLFYWNSFPIPESIWLYYNHISVAGIRKEQSDTYKQETGIWRMREPKYSCCFTRRGPFFFPPSFSPRWKGWKISYGWRSALSMFLVFTAAHCWLVCTQI